MKRPQFRIRTLLTIVAFAAVFVAWWADRRRLQARIDELEQFDRWEVVVFKKPANGPGSTYIKPLSHE